MQSMIGSKGYSQNETVKFKKDYYQNGVAKQESVKLRLNAF